MKNERTDAMKRFEKIAQKVYRNRKNAVNMLINDLEDFFEMHETSKNVKSMTSEEFDNYIESIYNQYEG